MGTSAEGLAARDDEHILIADTPAAFVRAVNRIIDDEALSSRLSAAGRRLVEAHFYSTDAVSAGTKKCLEVLAGRAHRPAAGA